MSAKMFHQKGLLKVEINMGVRTDNYCNSHQTLAISAVVLEKTGI